jgi:hypothetical protein
MANQSPGSRRRSLYGALAIAGWTIMGLTASLYGGVRDPAILLAWCIIGLVICIFVERRSRKDFSN